MVDTAIFCFKNKTNMDLPYYYFEPEFCLDEYVEFFNDFNTRSYGSKFQGLCFLNYMLIKQFYNEIISEEQLIDIHKKYFQREYSVKKVDYNGRTNTVNQIGDSEFIALFCTKPFDVITDQEEDFLHTTFISFCKDLKV
jgi:hypothetical protein